MEATADGQKEQIAVLDGYETGVLPSRGETTASTPLAEDLIAAAKPA
jgi:hypothetical protein